MSAPHCSRCRTDSTGIVLCCPIHAAADTAIDLLRRLVDFAPRIVAFESEVRSEANGRPLMASQSQTYNAILNAARTLLATIDGAAPAERGQ